MLYARWARIYVRQPVLHAFACEAPFRRRRPAREARGRCLCSAPAGQAVAVLCCRYEAPHVARQHEADMQLLERAVTPN